MGDSESASVKLILGVAFVGVATLSALPVAAFFERIVLESMLWEIIVVICLPL